jgi:hypothetical protein
MDLLDMKLPQVYALATDKFRFEDKTGSSSLSVEGLAATRSSA